MKTFYIVSEKERASVRFGELVILPNGIRVFVEKRGREWTVTELLTGMGVSLPLAVRGTLHAALDELEMLQDVIYKALRSVFALPSVRQLSHIMLRRGFEDGELNDICYYAKHDMPAEFLDEYKLLCEYALKWAKEFGKGQKA